ncbi:HNH endonuclease [Pseudomonas extremaustralis]|uniref:HNH endonuclease n=1 Tax=Pseudomonas extremaustralis TaxID=359110 RepID=UPI002AA8F463|nr:HNH endonuclease [Pseudomonas extremaustralis]
MTGSHPADDLLIDHINRIKDDNRWENLREATPSQNCRNREYGARNSQGRGASGTHGVYWDWRKNRWHVQMVCRGKFFYGGYHETLDAAQADAEVVRARLTEYAATFEAAA